MGSDQPGASPDEWAAGWESSRERQQRDIALATPAQLLAWLEEAIALAAKAGALPRPRKPSGFE